MRVLCGGEAMPRGAGGPVDGGVWAVWNMFGPTETTVWSTVFDVVAAGWGRSVPIGRPIDNTVCRVVGPDGRLVPVGGAGRVVHRWCGCGRGYRNRAELTAETVRRRPVRCRGAAVSHRGSGPLAGRRHVGVPRPGRSPGQGARSPHRARRDRDRPAGPSRRRRRRGRRPRPRRHRHPGRLRASPSTPTSPHRRRAARRASPAGCPAT